MDPTQYLDLPLEKKIAAASLIALVKHEYDSRGMKCTYSEILMKRRGTPRQIKVGDAHPVCHPPLARQHPGDGQVVFFVDGPRRFAWGAEIYGDQITGLENISLVALREQVKAAR